MSAATVVMDEKVLKIVNDYESFINNGQQKFVATREKGIASFEKLGLPTTKNEEWKYTNISSLIENGFYSPAQSGNLKSTDLQFDFLKDCHVMVFENGIFIEALSDLKNLQSGLTVTTLSQSENNSTLQNHFSKYAALEKHEFAALNTAFMSDGCFVHVDNNAVIEKPLYILNFTTGQSGFVANHFRTLIVAEKFSSAKIACLNFSIGHNNASLINCVHEIVAFENSNIEFDFVQNENENTNEISNSYIYQKRDSKVSVNTITLGGKLVWKVEKVEAGF